MLFLKYNEYDIREQVFRVETVSPLLCLYRKGLSSSLHVVDEATGAIWLKGQREEGEEKEKQS